MSAHYPTDEEPLDERAAARQLIATYQPHTTNGVVDQLCFDIDTWAVWNSIFTTVCEIGADVHLLATLSDAIMKTAAAAGFREGENWYEHHIGMLLMQSRESWDDYFSNEQPNEDAQRRNLSAFLGRLSVAGITACQIYFIGRFRHILDPDAGREWKPDLEDLVMIEDYFKITATWMKTQFGVIPDTHERWKDSMTYTEERWQRWKRSLRALAERSDETRRVMVSRILVAMG